MKKTPIVILLVAAAVGGGGYYYYKAKAGKTAAMAAGAQEAAPKTVKVERGTIDLKVSTTGRVASNLDVEIKSKASGQIIKVPFDISDTVTSGALLAELDPVDEKRNVLLREVALDSAKARLEQAREELRIAEINLETQTSSALAELASAQIRNQVTQSRLARAQGLFEKNLLSKEDRDAAETEAAAAANALRQAEIRVAETKTLPRTVGIRRQAVVLAEANVRQAEVDLENALQRLRETKIYAPIDGVVTDKKVQVGQIIASGVSNVGGGTTLMTLSDLSHIYTNANVDESDIGKVQTGQRAMITADAHIGKRFWGKVVRVATKGVNTNNVVTFEVKIEVEGEGRSLLKPEMTTNIEIQADRREDVLTLPNEVIQSNRRGSFVELVTGKDQTTTVAIKTGLTDGLRTEILEGLEENAEVAVPAIVQSRWARQDGQQGQQTFARGMQRAAFMSSRPGGGGGGRMR
ncbi:MAG: efflux RND transporter periplasmic adaptor subunit [Candidatus Sumerlaeaceae bacterium]|nr:efflux RND transporter periplasmic adaptor subunit [Candidatus Sumerlaeaceae bacterium]